MHKILRTIIANPAVINERFGNSTSKDAITAVRLTRLAPEELLRAVLNSYLHAKFGYQLNDTLTIPQEWVVDFDSIDDMYDQIAELYKSTVGVTPPTRQHFVVHGAAYTVTHPNIKSGIIPIIILKNPIITDGQLTIDPSTELEFTVIY